MNEYIKCGSPRRQQRRDRTEIHIIPFTIDNQRVDLTIPAELTVDELESEFQYIIDQMRLIERGDQ